MMSLVKKLKCISRLNIHHYRNRRYKSYITSLKAVIVGKSLISARLDIDIILHFVFMVKYSKFTDNIGSGNFTDTFYRNTDKFKKGGRPRGAGGAGFTLPHTSHAWQALAYILFLYQLSKKHANLTVSTKPFFCIC